MIDVNENTGRYGPFGGAFVAETLSGPLAELKAAYSAAVADPQFHAELEARNRDYIGRPTPLTLAARLTEFLGGARIYLKREDLAHTGAHKINNTLGQILLARRMGKTRIVAETGAGQHGVATAAVCAHFGLECVVYMGAVDMRRQSPNVERMKLMGAKVIGVDSGTATLKDAINEALRDWVANVHSTYYLLGSALGPHPYPLMVRNFQSIIGREAREQILRVEGRLPDELVACVGGGSNAIGLFHAFREDEAVRMTGVEAGGHGREIGQHAARFQGGSEGVFQGSHTYVLQDAHGNITETSSVSAGLDYAAVGPEHAQLRATGRATYTAAMDAEALAAFRLLSRMEGILPALESSHALAYAIREAGQRSRDQIFVVNLSGRGDKDLGILADYPEAKEHV